MVDPRKAGKAYLLEARNPYNSTPYNVIVTEITMESAKARGLGAVEELRWSVPLVLRRPLAVFRGVRERGDNNWLCYAGRPRYYYNRLGRRVDAVDDEIFLVFVTERQIVYTYRWEDADPKDSDLPEDHKNRFDKRLRHNDSP